MSFDAYLADSAGLIEKTKQHGLGPLIERAVDVLAAALARRAPVLICGNGGSASDAMHIAGELVGRFLIERRAMNVIALAANPAVLTAWSNDHDYASVFARQVEAHGQAGGVVWGISTSGNSPNVVKAFEQARAMAMATIGLTGEGGGQVAACSDLLLTVPSRSTPRIQEMHVIIYHYICARVEETLAGRSA